MDTKNQVVDLNPGSASAETAPKNLQALIETAVQEVGQILLGKEAQIRLALCCLFARGHLLIEDLPGMGKTTLSHALATVLGLSWRRVQFTSDLLPADILGVSVFDKNDASFTFHPAPSLRSCCWRMK